MRHDSANRYAVWRNPIVLFAVLGFAGMFAADGVCPQSIFAQTYRLGESKRELAHSIELRSIELRSGNFCSRTVRYPRTPYNPSPGWTIESHSIRRISAGGTRGLSVTVVAGGSEFTSKSEMLDAYNYAINAAAKRGDERLSARFREEMSERLSLYAAISSSHNAVVADAYVTCPGRLSDRTSRLKAEIYAHLRYVGTESADDLRRRLLRRLEESHR